MEKNLIKQKIKDIISKYNRTINKIINFRMIEEIVQLRNGKIKDGELYIDAKTKMTFFDQLGNEFKMNPNSVKSGSWSPFESAKVFNNPQYHIKELTKIALSKGGKIKEGQVYINSLTKMTFIDQLGNEFEMVPSVVKSGSWSPFESGKVFNNPQHHIKELTEIVLSKGGKIKEGEVYINSLTKMTFIDQLGNEFKMIPKQIKKGQWSPLERNCSEHICRQIIEQIYMNKFPSAWDVVKRNNHNKLQLDGYCKELNIAFEYQGIQHSNGWGTGLKQQESLIQIKKRDNEKKQACKNKKILLLEIDYYPNISNIPNMIQHTVEYIKKSYEVNNEKIPEFISYLNIENIKLDLSKISHLFLITKHLKEIVSQRKGKIKEGEVYINNLTKMTFIDQFGNEFKMTPSAVKDGCWSHFESGNVRDTEYHTKKIQKIVLSRGGSIKEGEIYINNSTKMAFIDKLGNKFEMTPHHIKVGQWSPYEAGNVINPNYHMQKLKEIALSKGGSIKEGEVYINNLTKIAFIDKLGNEFKMMPKEIKKGSWSPYEVGKVFNNPEYHIKELQKIALSKSGNIKSGQIYINNSTKMTFIDQFGNEFKKTPNSVKRGQWSRYKSLQI